MDSSDQREGVTSSRATTLILTGVIGVAVVGFFVGTVGSWDRADPETGAAAVRPPRSPASGSAAARPAPGPSAAGVHSAVTYTQMREFDLGPNAQWSTRLETLEQPKIDLFAEILADPDAKRASLANRESLRAYNGAPPVVPHAVDQISVASCLGCHEQAIAVGARASGKIPHPILASCTQCHVERRSAELAPFELAGNSFVGLSAPFEGPRAGPGAPPQIPHSTLMRTDCLSCHGPLGDRGMRTTHPWRASCLQCHAPSATLDQYAASELPNLLPGPVIINP